MNLADVKQYFDLILLLASVSINFFTIYRLTALEKIVNNVPSHVIDTRMSVEQAMSVLSRILAVSTDVNFSTRTLHTKSDRLFENQKDSQQTLESLQGSLGTLLRLVTQGTGNAELDELVRNFGKVIRKT